MDDNMLMRLHEMVVVQMKMVLEVVGLGDVVLMVMMVALETLLLQLLLLLVQEVLGVVVVVGMELNCV